MESTSPHLDYSQMFELADPLTNRPLRMDITEQSKWLTAEIVYQLAHGLYVPEIPLRLRAYQGTQPADFLWGSFARLVCITERVVNLLHTNLVTGWRTFPVDLYNRKGESLPGYRGLAIVGSECLRDRSRSSIISKPPPTPKGRGYDVYKGLYFHETEWDGSDMFWIRNNGVIVTEKVKSLFREARVTNVKLVPLTEVERDVKLDRFEK